MTNINLLNNLKNDTYCRLKPSSVHGIGVFAIRDIPKGVNPFKLTNDKCVNYNASTINKAEYNTLPKPVKKLLNDFIHPNKDGSFDVPYLGFNSIDLSFYMNHCENNNIDVDSTCKCTYYRFITNKIIKSGEELFINYKHYDLID